MTAKSDLLNHVRTAAADGPYVVEEKPYGFDLTINVADAQWYTLLRRNGIQRAFTHEVHLDESRKKMTITDVANSVRWDAAAGLSSPPSLHAEKSVQRGRVYQHSFHHELGVDAATGNAGTVVDYRFDAGEGRHLIRDASHSAGWSEGLGREQRIGLAVGLGVIAALAVVGFVALVVALTR